MTTGAAASPTPEPLVLRTPEHFKALGHPVRHRIVNVLRQRPATLGQLASAMGLAKGTISFHIRVLRAAGLVRLAGTRHVRGGTEQYFALVGTGFRLHEDAGAGPEFLIQAALAELPPAEGSRAGHTVLQHLWLTEQQARTLAAQLEDFITRQHPADGAAGEPYGLLLSLYRTDIPRLPAAPGQPG
ncbi:MAG TPA: helix-turn-helix domain-containing protein [Trebonia sp.]|jgi:DNA-binding transcriptional ArsR family regulator|nr:helix-turn-helix domain-containing protein [Trebonia sp.]